MVTAQAYSVYTVGTERTVLLVPLIILGIVNVLVDTSAQIKVTKGPDRGQIELSKLLSQHFAAATTLCLWMARMCLWAASMGVV